MTPEIPDVLKSILAVKEREIQALRDAFTMRQLEALAGSAPAPRGFLRALHEGAARRSRVGLIAEVKKASPSKGVIRADFDPCWIAERYAAGGADALSVLTDVSFFQGHLDYLRQVRQVVELPVLRKDFLVDESQVLEARGAGADAILLIAACLAPGRLHQLLRLGQSLGMDVLVEIHSREEWQALLAVGPAPALLGINNRDLRSFHVSLEVTAELAAEVVAEGSFLVAESGIFTPDHVDYLHGKGARAILVGESLMREPDPGEAARRLLAPVESTA